MIHAMNRQTERAPRVVLFGRFSLDLEVGELRRGGEVVSLRPKPLLVLARLVENAGSLTPRDELMQTVWGDVHLASDTVLHTAIGEVRQVLEDNASRPRFVETVHRRGYRFIAPVRRVDDVPATESGSTERTLATSRTRRAAAVIVVAVGLGALWMAVRAAPRAAAPGRPVDASEKLLRARYLVNHGTPEEIATGARQLRDAVIQPDAGALAWSGLAVGELRLGNTDAARDAASHALQFDPDSGEAYRVLGQALMVQGDMQEAERLLLTALELDPSTGKAHYAYSLLLALSGRIQEAERIAETAAVLAPRTMAVQLHLARMRYYSRDFEGAVEAARRVLDLDEGGVLPAASTVQAALWFLGDIAGARDAAVVVARQLGASPEELSRFASGDAEDGLGESLRWQIARLREEPEPAPERPINIACLCVQLGDIDCASRALREAPPAHTLDLPTRLHDPQLDIIRTRRGAPGAESPESGTVPST